MIGTNQRSVVSSRSSVPIFGTGSTIGRPGTSTARSSRTIWISCTPLMLTGSSVSPMTRRCASLTMSAISVAPGLLSMIGSMITARSLAESSSVGAGGVGDDGRELATDLGVVEDRFRLIGVGFGAEHGALQPPSAHREAQRHTGEQQEYSRQGAPHYMSLADRRPTLRVMAAPPVPTRPALGTMVRRGLLRKCPWCGDRHAYFTRWFSKQRACRKCGTPWRRGDVGFELGAATINTIITFGVIIVAGAVAMIATSPDIPTVKIVVCLVDRGDRDPGADLPGDLHVVAGARPRDAAAAAG